MSHKNRTQEKSLDKQLPEKPNFRLRPQHKLGLKILLVACLALIAILIPSIIYNVTRPNTPPTPEDHVPPVIALNGDTLITIDAGSTFNDPGATATDNNAEIPVQTSGTVDTNKSGFYTITYTATDASNNTATITRIVQVTGAQPNGSIIYLTFDDGPSPYTGQLLDVLKKYNVKATFFVTGAGSEDDLRREYNEGHAIGLHTFSHNYSYVYQSLANFYEDLYKVQDHVKAATGYTSYLMRFPGGSSNTVSINYDGGSHIMSRLARDVEAKGFTYFDWNISSGDAGGATTAGEVYDNVTRALNPGGGRYVVLQHDTKEFSVNAVEDIIKYGLDNGYTFSKLDATSFSAHHGVNN